MVVVQLWLAFWLLLVGAPDALDDAWSWIRGLPIVLELAAWLLALPWMLGLAVWATPWALWLKLALIACFALGWSNAFFPRRRAS